MPSAHIDEGRGGSAEYRIAESDVVYERIVGVPWARKGVQP